jgi:phosphoribosyl-dephospho-CoA transferase
MKTTIEMPDDLFRRAKATAALQGLSLKEWLTKVLSREVGATNVVPDLLKNEAKQAEVFNQELNRLAALVGKHWQGEQDAVAAIKEERRG